MGDFKLKADKGYVPPEGQRMTADSKKQQARSSALCLHGRQCVRARLHGHSCVASHSLKLSTSVDHVYSRTSLHASVLLH